MVPYVALPKLSAPPLYAAYTQPIRSYTPDLYAQSIRQIHLYAAYTSGYTPGPIRQNTVLHGVGRPAPFRNGHQKCCSRPTVGLSDRPTFCPSDHPAVRPSDHPTVPPSIDFHCLHRSLQLYADLYVRYTPPHTVYDLYVRYTSLYADIRRGYTQLYAHIRYTQLYVRRPSILASPHMVP